jgi:hypothetical protein
MATEWYWKCLLRRYVCQGLAMILALLSVLVVWSELTFFNASPVLSIFAIFVNLAKEYYDYLSIEVSSFSSYSSKIFWCINGQIFSTCSWFQLPPSPTCACALIRQCWKFAYSICIIWHPTTKRTSIVWSFRECYFVGWLRPCVWTSLAWFTWTATLSKLVWWKPITLK